MSKVKASAEFIANNSQSVFVNYARCKEAAQEIKKQMKVSHYSPETWSSHPLNPEPDFPNLADWVFTVDLLNFSFWSDLPRFTVTYKSEVYTGYWSLVACINRALDNNIPITTPTFWYSKEFTFDLLKQVFRSDNHIDAPLLSERYQVLVEAGQVFKSQNLTSFEEVLAHNNNSALQTIDWVTSNIPSFDDKAVYKGRTVYIYKRAQILVGDLWACFRCQGFGKFDDIDEITMFADYRVPQILYTLGCIEYSPALKQKIQSKVPLESGSSEEVEIRGCSIHAVELIVAEIKNINAILADFYLWDTAKMDEKKNTEIIECHRVRSVYY